MVTREVRVTENLGMKINIEKTEIQHMRRAHKDLNTVINKNLKQAVNFVYLGGNLSLQEGIISDVKRWIGIAMGVLQTVEKSQSARDITTTGFHCLSNQKPICL